VAIPCGACSKPVHEHAVLCPHCGEHTGVNADARLTAEEAAAAVELARIQNDKLDPRPMFGMTDYRAGRYGYDPEIALIGGAAVAAVAVGAVIKSAVEAVVDERAERASRPELPRAYAREKTHPPVHLEPTVEPEPAPPPSDTPRFLK